MDTTIFVLQVLLYTFGIILLIVLTILGLKSITVIDKADKIMDNIDDKVNSLNTLFNTIDRLSSSVSLVTNSFLDKSTKIMSKIFRSKKRKNREEKDYE